MTDAVVLLALSQLVCLGGLAYLFSKVTKLQARIGEERLPSARVRPLPEAIDILESVPPSDRARRAPARPESPLQPDLATVTRRMSELGVDIPSLARRMHRSEEEIRLLLRRQGAA